MTYTSAPKPIKPSTPATALHPCHCLPVPLPMLFSLISSSKFCEVLELLVTNFNITEWHIFPWTQNQPKHFGWNLSDRGKKKKQLFLGGDAVEISAGTASLTNMPLTENVFYKYTKMMLSGDCCGFKTKYQEIRKYQSYVSVWNLKSTPLQICLEMPFFWLV